MTVTMTTNLLHVIGSAKTFHVLTQFPFAIYDILKFKMSRLSKWSLCSSSILISSNATIRILQLFV